METPHSPEVGEQLPVQVLLRLRPLIGQRETIVVHSGPRSIKICNPVQTTSASGESVIVSKRMEYCFDWVLPESSSQQDTFRKSCPSMLRHFLSGGNALLFCYGPSGSGKTYTILGDEKNLGLLPNLLRTIFASIDAANAANAKSEPPCFKSGADVSVYPLLPGMEYNVWITYLECYNERVYDLLLKKSGSAKDAAAAHPAPLDVKYTKNHVPIIPSNEPLVEQYQQAMQWLHVGQNNRQTGSTHINKTSSRSHAVFTIKLTQTPIGATEEDIKANPSIVRYSKFSVVDLAGSERTGKSQATGDRLREASNINNSLLTLKRCMKALQQNQMLAQTNAAAAAAALMNAVPTLSASSTSSSSTSLRTSITTGSGDSSTQKPVPAMRRVSVDKGLGAAALATTKQPEVVPFRESILTKLLREYLQGEGKCSVIVNIHPAPADYEESLQALDFGTITKAVKTTTCKKKIVTRTASPPQPIPFSLTQANASVRIGGKESTSSNNATNATLSSTKKPSALNLLERLQQQQQQQQSYGFPLGGANKSNIGAGSVVPHSTLNTSLNASLNASTMLNRSTASSIAPPVEASSPSKSALDRSRVLYSSSNTASPSLKRLAFDSPLFDDAVVAGVAMQLFKPKTRHGVTGAPPSSVANGEVCVQEGEEDLDGDEEEFEEEVMAFDEMELIEEVNRLRVALADAENRIIEVEMSVRSEVAQEMADRISEMDAFYRRQSDARVRHSQEKYEKLQAYYQQQEESVDFQQQQEKEKEVMVGDKSEEEEEEEEEEMSESGAEDQANAFNLLVEKEAALDQMRAALEMARLELSSTTAKLRALQESAHRQLQEAQERHREEVAIFNLKLEAMVAKEKEKAMQVQKEMALDTETATVAAVTTAADVPSTTMTSSSLGGGGGKKSSNKQVDEPHEESMMMVVDVEVDAKKASAANKKRRGKAAEVVPAGRSKVSKVQEDTTPASSLQHAKTDPFEFPTMENGEEEKDCIIELVKEASTSSKSSAKRRRSASRAPSAPPVPTVGRTTDKRGSKKVKNAVVEVEVEDDGQEPAVVIEAEDDVVLVAAKVKEEEEEYRPDDGGVVVVEKQQQRRKKKKDGDEVVVVAKATGKRKMKTPSSSAAAAAETTCDEDQGAESVSATTTATIESTPTKTPLAAAAAAKLSLRGRKLASPSSPHLTTTTSTSSDVTPSSPIIVVTGHAATAAAARGSRKGALAVGKVIGIKMNHKDSEGKCGVGVGRGGGGGHDECDDDENRPEDEANQHSVPLPARTPLTKRLRSRRPVDLLPDSTPLDEVRYNKTSRSSSNSTAPPSSSTTSTSTSGTATARRRGAASAPRYLGNFL